MKLSIRFTRHIGLSVVLSLLAATQLFSQTVLPNHVPSFVTPASDLGPASLNEQVKVKVWLKLHNADALDQYIEDIYNPESPKYRQFLTEEQIDSQYSPDAREAEAVQKFLKSKGLQVTAVDEKNSYVEATGAVAALQQAFKVQLHNYRVQGQVVRSNNANPTIDDANVGATVASVSGLTSTQMKPHNLRPRDPDGKVLARSALTPNGVFFEGNCFFGVQSHTFKTSTTSGSYTGNRYGAATSNQNPPHLPPCGYSPQNLYSAYNLNGLYRSGLDGSGQSVVIVDAYGSTTIAADLAAFSATYGLPTASLKVIGTPIAPGKDTTIQGWMDETTLDVEWAHAIAPGAKIVLVIAPTPNNDDLAAAITKAVNKGFGNVISNSYGSPESTNAPADFAVFETALKLAAARGVAVNFSSADDGDFILAQGYSDVSYPASSKFATGIGGTSVILNANQKIRFQAPWGTNLTAIANTDALANPPYVPPLAEGFQFGAGGGTSREFSKPSFQNGLPGSHRLVPDIGWVADPYTGVEIIETDLTAKQQLVGVIGGTSVACPMFSGLWAVAAQKHGGPLGQAARSLYRLPGSAITDVTAVDFGTNVTGLVKDPSGTTTETARKLATPTPQIKTFTSAFYHSPVSSRWFVLTFGTDSSLSAKPGWDEVTGLGTPNGVPFVNAAAK